MIHFPPTKAQMPTPSFKLLYVCNGNNARSPLAAACTGALLGREDTQVGWEISSAGTQAVEGDVVRPEVLQAAESIGLDLSGHRTTALQPGDCDEPDLILGMSWEHVSDIWSLVPGVWDKVFTIKEFIHWAKRAPVRPPILFPDVIAEMRDKVIQAHVVRKRARADHGFWGGIRPQDLNLIEPHGKGDAAWTTLAHATNALVSDVITLLRSAPTSEPAPRPSHKSRRAPRAKSRAKARR